MFLAADVGGTKTLLASLTSTGKREQELKFATAQVYDQFLEDFTKAFTMLKNQDYQAAAVAIPGKIDRRTGGVGIAFGNLPWRNVPLQEDLEKITNCPVLIENDAKVAGLDEAKLVIKDFKKILFITIGTGIGIAIINDGIIDTNFADLGGGTFRLEHNGKLQTWDSFASGKAITKEYGKKAAEITDKDTWKAIARKFAAGILELTALTEPDAIIIGGGVGSHFDHFGNLLTDELKKYETPLMPIPPIKQAEHAEQAVIYGCYELLRDHYGSNS